MGVVSARETRCLNTGALPTAVPIDRQGAYMSVVTEQGEDDPHDLTGSTSGAARSDSPFQILSLSGGGYRGLFTARILADLEERIGAPIATRFDLIAGTSI